MPVSFSGCEMKLDDRLKSAASLVTGQTFIDIGTDHGYLPVWLLLNGKCAKAAAADINIHPLESAKANAARYGVEDRMEFFLSDGFDSVNGVYDTAAICGMGGILMADIIERGKGKFRSLVLQPMTNAEILRRYLWDNGYVIDKELYCVSLGKPYAVLHASYTGEKTPYTYSDTYLGKCGGGECYVSYCRKMLSSAKKRLSGKLISGDDAEDERKLVEKCEKIVGR